LAIHNSKSASHGLPAERNFNIILVAKDKGTGTDAVEKFDKILIYKGKKVIVRLY
jgi:hypothetical protein